MKKLLLTSLFTLCITHFLMAQVSYWPLNVDGSDASGSTNLSFMEGTVIEQEANRYDVASFNGEGAYIFAPNTILSHDEITLNVWFMWTTEVQAQWWVRLFDFGELSDPDPGNHDVYFATLYADGKFRWAIHTKDWAAGSDTMLHSLQATPVNEWIMATFIHTTDSAYLYFNGVLQEKQRVGFSPSHLSFKKCYFGKSNWPADPSFKGYLDDIQLCDRKIVQSEIDELYSTAPVDYTSVEKIKQTEIPLYSRDGRIILDLPGTARNIQVNVYNMLGKNVFTGNPYSLQSQRFSSGVYIVTIKTGNTGTTSKVLVKE